MKGFIKHKEIITKEGRLTGEQMDNISRDANSVIDCMEKLTKKKLDNYTVGYSAFHYKNCRVGEVYKEESKEDGVTYYLITEVISNNKFYCYSIYSK